ncbi:MAG: TrmH family RNA methyltransferase [Novosphingobium sp.]
MRLSGIDAVKAQFEVDPGAIERLFFAPRMRMALARITTRLSADQVPWREVDDRELERIAGAKMNGGVVAIVRDPPLDWASAGEIRSWAPNEQLVLVLDGVGNPQNIGAIARTAAFFGLRRLVLSDHPDQAVLSDASHRIAKGGLQHLKVARVRDLARVLAGVRRDYRVIGTAAPGHPRARPHVPSDQKPTLLVMGNEEIGLPPATLAACEHVITLTGGGAMQSLNVSVTAGILLHTLLSEMAERAPKR